MLYFISIKSTKNKTQTIKNVREIFPETRLEDAEEAVEYSAEIPVQGTSLEIAQKAAQELRGTGATVEVENEFGGPYSPYLHAVSMAAKELGCDEGEIF